YFPEGSGYFIEKSNFEPANPLQTPDHIAPVWYFTPFYAILRAITFSVFGLEAKFLGIMFMGGAIAVLFVLPWLDRSPVRSMRYKGWMSKAMLLLFVVSFVLLGILGVLPSTAGRTMLAQVCTFVYFAFFLLMPIYTKLEKTKPLPSRVTG
ncbi:MAG: cytochrome b, partial [Halomonas sp.]